MSRIERPRCNNPYCSTHPTPKKMHTATIRLGSAGSGGTVIIGFYCRDCGVFQSLGDMGMVVG